MKPDCYKCEYRQDIPGDAHSSCRNPLLGHIKDDPLYKVWGILASVGRVSPIQAGIDELAIKANYHGIKNGWFNFPFNFDPIWLEECNGFKSKGGQMPDRIADIIQEYADCSDEFDIKKVAADIRSIALLEYGIDKLGIIAVPDTEQEREALGWHREEPESIPYNRLLIGENVYQCTYCGHNGQDVLQYIGKIGGSDEPRTITACSDIDACLKRKESVK